jgi:hypothetical protein
LRKKTREGDGIAIWVTYLIVGLSIDKQKLPMPNNTHIAPSLQLPIAMNIGNGLLVFIFMLGLLIGLIKIDCNLPLHIQFASLNKQFESHTKTIRQ